MVQLLTKQRAKRPSFGILLPGDVLVHRSNERDIAIVTRVGTRLDLRNLVDGRHLEAWVFAGSSIPPEYTVVRGDEIIVRAA